MLTDLEVEDLIDSPVKAKHRLAFSRDATYLRVGPNAWEQVR